MGIEDDPQHPLWSTFDSSSPPKSLYVGYYKGLTGRWLMTGSSYLPDTPQFICAQFDRDVKLLRYELIEERDFPMTDRLEYRKQRAKKFKSSKSDKPLRVRKPIRVRMPKGG